MAVEPLGVGFVETPGHFRTSSTRAKSSGVRARLKVLTVCFEVTAGDRRVEAGLLKRIPVPRWASGRDPSAPIFPAVVTRISAATVGIMERSQSHVNRVAPPAVSRNHPFVVTALW